MVLPKEAGEALRVRGLEIVASARLEAAGGPGSAGILPREPRVVSVLPFILSHQIFFHFIYVFSVVFASLQIPVLVLMAHRLVKVVEGNVDDFLVVVALPEWLKTSLVLPDL